MWLTAAVLAAVLASPIWRFATDDATRTVADVPAYRGIPVARLTKQVRAHFAYGPKGEAAATAGQAWVNACSRPRWASIAKNWAGSEDWGQFHFGLYYDSGELEAHIQDSSGKEITVRDRVPLPLNVWHHVAFVADVSTLRLYRDGREIDSAPYRELRSDPRIKALPIGTKLNLRGDAPEERDFNMWDGRLDELVIFNYALAPEQIHELFVFADVARSSGPQ